MRDTGGAGGHRDRPLDGERRPHPRVKIVRPRFCDDRRSNRGFWNLPPCRRLRRPDALTLNPRLSLHVGPQRIGPG